MEMAKESGAPKNYAGSVGYQQPSVGVRAVRSLSAIIFSQQRLTWMFLDFTLSLVFFFQCALLNPISNLASQSEIWVSSLIYSICFSVIALGAGLYDREHRFIAKSYIRMGFMVWFLALTVSLAGIYFLLYWKVSRYVMVFGSVGDYLFLCISHSLLGSVFNRHFYRYVILGEPSAISEEIKRASNNTRKGMRYFHVDDLQILLSDYESYSPQEIIQTLQKYQIPDIILTEQASKDHRVLDLCVHAMQAGCRVIDEIHFYSELFESFPAKILSENWLVLSGINTHRPLNNFSKRAFDFTLSLICMVLFAPLLFLIVLLIKVTSSGPILFLQERQGRYGKPIRVLKFRTMSTSLVRDNPPSTRLNDPRVTSLGRLIRPLHLDELPQLWNIMKGEMSFVGPRPEVYSFTMSITKEVPIYKFRNLVRPGLTGLSQISIGYTQDNAQDTLVKLAYDLYYVKNFSFFMDLLIMLRTFFVLTKGSR